MKLLYVTSHHFKNLCDDCEIDFIAKSKKTTEDKEYELQEIADGLFVFNTVAFVGKNASGKTSVLELLDCAYSILGDFSVEDKDYSYDDIYIELIFYHENSIYKYSTSLQSGKTLNNKAIFYNQKLFVKKYCKSKLNTILSDEDFKPYDITGKLPEDTSILFFVLGEKKTRSVFFNSTGEGVDTYRMLFNTLSQYDINVDILTKVLRIFDNTIVSINQIDEHNYTLVSTNDKKSVSDKELLSYLSSGTTKGMLLYIMIVASLKNGFDLIIDEIENHFHKTLVENIISLYKEKSVNRNNATLYFATHYLETLDLFNRQDNIWICRLDNKITLNNMYSSFTVRPELLKSKQFYSDTFKTAVNYDDLMALKKELLK